LSRGLKRENNNEEEGKRDKKDKKKWGGGLKDRLSRGRGKQNDERGKKKADSINFLFRRVGWTRGKSGARTNSMGQDQREEIRTRGKRKS